MQALIGIGIVLGSIVGIILLLNIMAFLGQHFLKIFGVFLLVLGVVGVFILINAIKTNDMGLAIIGTIFSLIGVVMVFTFIAIIRG